MKRKLLLGVLCVPMIFAACSKDDKQDAIAFTYNVNNVQDQTIMANGTTNMQVQTTTLTGNPEPVTLTLKGLPSDVTATPATTTGNPDFTTDIVFSASNATVGTYPVTLEATSASTIKKTYNFNLKVNAQPIDDCALEVVASYAGLESCTIGNDNYTITVTGTGTANKVVIGNLYNIAGGNPYALLNCSAKTFTIPSQTVTTTSNGTVTYSGSGSYTSTSITITYTISSGSDTNTCTATFNR